MSDPQGLPSGAQIVAGPERVGSEQRWRVRLVDGRPALLARLAPELARDLALRRRYVRDLERLRALTGSGGVPGVAPVLALGPEPDAAAPDAAPPWRLRLDPPGETVEAWLSRRAPVPPDEAAALGAELAELLAPLHERGVVLRDLHPRLIVRDAGRMWLTDVGLGRVDILSTRTAASLLLEGSPYAAPEQLQRTALDPRADLYPLGVILYRALTGLLPRGDGPAFLAEDPVAPPIRLRPELPRALDRLVLRCLEVDPIARPASARELAAALRGEIGPDGDALARVVCQHCNAPLRLGQRLCLACGRVAVDFAAEPGAAGGRTIQLRAAKEDTAFLARLYDTLSPLHDGVVPPLNFVIGDARMYSKAELERRIRLPVPLFSGLAPATAERLAARLKQGGLSVRVVDDTRSGPPSRGRVALWTGVGFAVPALAALLFGAPVFVYVLLLGLATFTGAMVQVAMRKRRSQRRDSLLKLRQAPALPASDPLVARLAGLLGPTTRPELRELVGGLALAVQRLVDHRAAAPGARAELDMLTAPVTPLVDLVVAQVGRLGEIDGVLAGLDEGELVRALAVSEARDEPAARRHELLLGLDRLRGLEDERAAIFHRLLEAESLLRRAVEVGLGVRDEDAGQARAVDQALHALTRGAEES